MRTSSTLITAGLYCSSNGIENRSLTFPPPRRPSWSCPVFQRQIPGLEANLRGLSGLIRIRWSLRIGGGGWYLYIRRLRCRRWLLLGRPHLARALDLNIRLGTGIRRFQVRLRPFRHAYNMWRQDHQDLVVVGASIIVREQVLKDGNMREARPTLSCVSCLSS